MMHKGCTKILSVILSLLALFSVCSVCTSAANPGMTLTAQSLSAKPGDTVQMKITLQNNPGIASLKFHVSYDSVLSLTKVELSGDFGQYITAPTPYKNPQPISMISPMRDVKTNGTVATLTFKVSDSLTDTYKAKVTLSFDEDDVFDSDFKAVSLTAVEGVVTVTGKSTKENHVVTLNKNDGTNETTNILVSSVGSVKLPKPTKSGYTCVGWSKDKNAVLPTYKCDTEFKTDADVNLYAVWAKNNSKVTGVTVDEALSLHYKDVASVKADVKTQNDARYALKWTSSDESIAKVDASGKVTAAKRGKGTATITCTATDGFGNTVQDTCTVKVSLTVWQWIKTYIFFGWIWY